MPLVNVWKIFSDYGLKVQLFLFKDGFGIKYHMKVDMPLNKEIKSNQTIEKRLLTETT